MANSMREKVGEVLKGFLDSKTAVLQENHAKYVLQATSIVKKLEDEKRELAQRIASQEQQIARLTQELNEIYSMSAFQIIRAKWLK